MNRLTKREPYWLGEEFWMNAEEPDEEEVDNVYEKLKYYEDLEEKLESVYGECEGLLETVVDYLVKHPEIEIDDPSKARLLTDEDVDKWDSFKHIPCKVGDILYCVIEDELEEDGYFISEEQIVEVGTRGVWLSGVVGKDSMDCFISYDEFDKDVFLNKENIKR